MNGSSDGHHDTATPLPVLVPDTTPRRPGRPRRRSSDRAEVTRQRLLVSSALDLLCQRLDPFPLLPGLRQAAVLGDGDVAAFQGHPDRRLICESMARALMEGTLTQLRDFCQVLGGFPEQKALHGVLAAMLEVDRLLHELPCRAEEAALVVDEKTVTFDLGYWNPDTGSLKPLVELQRARAASNRTSRLSAASHVTLDALEDGEPRGVPVLCLYVTGHALSGPRAQALAALLGWGDAVLELRAGKTQLSGEDVAVLARALHHNRSLTSLDLRLNPLGGAGAAACAEMLRHNSHLRHLNLSSTAIGAAGVKAVAVAVATSRTLEELDLSFLDAGDVSCENIRDLLKANHTLQKLRLRSDNITWAGCCPLAEGLARNRSLVELDLSRNALGDAGLELLAACLPESGVAELSLENCGLTAAAGTHLAELLSASRQLRHLDLSLNLLGDEGVARLAPALERTSTLVSLGLNMCGITNAGFSRLLDVLEKNASIALLKLCYNRLGRDAAPPPASSDNLRYRLRIVTSSKPRLKILLWGNTFEES